MSYNPFVLVDAIMLAQLRNAGYLYIVLQRFSWPGLAAGHSFLLSPYRAMEAAQQHAAALHATEGKSLELAKDEQRLLALMQGNPPIGIFLNQIKDQDWQKKMLQAYKNNIIYYLGHKTAFKRKSSITIHFSQEYGRIYALISDAVDELRVEAMALIG